MKLLDLLMMEGICNFDVLHVMSQWIGQLLFSEEIALSRFQGGTFDIENKQKARTREEYIE